MQNLVKKLEQKLTELKACQTNGQRLDLIVETVKNIEVKVDLKETPKK